MAEKRENFTVDRVASARCESDKTQTIIWDGKAPGFRLRVTHTGAKAYIFESRLHGHTVRMTIGSPDTWPLETQWRKEPATGERYEYRRGARDEAQRLKALTDQGIDPRTEVAAKKRDADATRSQAARKLVTLGEAYDVFLEDKKPFWKPITKLATRRLPSLLARRRRSAAVRA